MESYWESSSLSSCDFAVVGGGMLGLWTAIELARQAPEARIVVLERGAHPLGASSRNAGFACFGSLTEIAADIARVGSGAALALVEQRWQGLQKIRRTFDQQRIGYVGNGGFEILTAEQVGALDLLDQVNAELFPIFGSTVFHDIGSRREQFGFAAVNVAAMIGNTFEGEIDTGRYLSELMRLAAQHGIRVRTGCRVEQVQELGEAGVAVRMATPIGDCELRAKCLAYCCNGFLPELVEGTGVVPGRGQVLITEPIAGLTWRGCVHCNEGYDYFRTVPSIGGRRLLIGGGRHLALAEETTAEIGLNAELQLRLEQLLRDTILPGREFAVAQRWAGIMGFAADKLPKVQAISGRRFWGFACNGMGVALTPVIGEQVAAAMLAAH